MCGKPDNTWEQDHRRLVQLAAKDEPTERDITESKEIIFKTQLEVSVKTNQLENDYDVMYERNDWTTDEPALQIEDWQRLVNDFNWAVLHALQHVQTVAMDCGGLAKKAGRRAEARAVRVNTRKTSAECASAQAKTGEEPKDKDSGWGFLLEW